MSGRTWKREKCASGRYVWVPQPMNAQEAERFARISKAIRDYLAEKRGVDG